MENIMKEGDVSYSLEAFYNDTQHLEVISTEGLFSFFTNLKNSISSAIGTVKRNDPSLEYKDATKDIRKVKNALGKLTNVDLTEMIVVVPNKFGGNLVDFTNDLASGYELFSKELTNCLKLVTTDMATLVNSSEDKTFPKNQSINSVRVLRKHREAYMSTLSNYFKLQRPKSYAPLIEVIKSPNEINKLFERLDVLERVISELNSDNLVKIVDNFDNDIDSYIEILSAMDGKFKNSPEVKEMSESLYEIAKDIEFVGYIQANTLQLYKTVESISNVVIKRVYG